MAPQRDFSALCDITKWIISRTVLNQAMSFFLMVLNRCSLAAQRLTIVRKQWQGATMKTRILQILGI